MSKVLLDTDIFSEILKEKCNPVTEKANRYYDKFGYYTISCFTVIEILKGSYKDNNSIRINKILNNLNDWEILELTKECWEISARILAQLEKCGNNPGVFDVFIASIAIANKLTVITGNTKHFETIKSICFKLGYILNLDNWRE
jgi:tRNA(fMet)-specific endonuclease VapC